MAAKSPPPATQTDHDKLIPVLPASAGGLDGDGGVWVMAPFG